MEEKRSVRHRDYQNEYRKKYIKRVPLDMQIEKYNAIKEAAKKNGETVNGYIKKAIDDRLYPDGNVPEHINRRDLPGMAIDIIAIREQRQKEANKEKKKNNEDVMTDKSQEESSPSEDSSDSSEEDE